jgi:hypothetical protein
VYEDRRGKADLHGDGIITVDEAYNYVSKKVPEVTDQNQNPVKKGEVEGQPILDRVRSPAHQHLPGQRMNKPRVSRLMTERSKPYAALQPSKEDLMNETLIHLGTPWSPSRSWRERWTPRRASRCSAP